MYSKIRNGFERLRQVFRENALLITTLVGIFILTLIVKPEPYIVVKDYCLQYFQENTIYGGQPHCIQGFVMYGFALFFDTLNLLSFFYFTLIPLTLFYLLKIKERETNDKSILFFSIMYGLVVLVVNDFATMLTMTFIVLGWYYLKEKTMWGHIFLALALFTKVSAIFVIIPLLLFYLRMLKYIFPYLLLVIFGIFNYQHFIDYYIFVPSSISTNVSLLTVFKTFIVLPYNGLYMILLIAFFLVLIRRILDVYAVILGLCLPIFYLRMMGIDDLAVYHAPTRFYYFAVFLPFYLILLYKVKQEYQQYQKSVKIFFGIILILLCIPLYQALGGIPFHLSPEKILDHIKMDVAFPFLNLTSDSQIIVSKEYAFLHENNIVNVNPTYYDLSAKYRPDEDGREGYIKLGIIDSVDGYLFNTSEVKFPPLHNYSHIVVYPDNDLYDLKRYFKENNISLQTEMCAIFSPYLIDPYIAKQENYVMIYFVDQNQCYQYKQDLQRYYFEHFDELCHHSDEIIKAVEKVLNKNGMTMGRACHSITKTGVFLSKEQIQESYFVLGIILFLYFLIIKNISLK